MSRRPITVEDLWALPRVGPPKPSKDGAWAVVPVTTYSMEENKGTTRLWLVPARAEGAGSRGKRDPARALTSKEHSSSQPAWSPDGTRIAFVRKPGGEPASDPGAGPEHPDQGQIYVLNLDGGEPERMTDLPLGAVDPRWFPDGRRIAFLTPVYGDAPALADTAQRAKDEAKSKVKARVTEDRLYRYWDSWLTDGRVHHVFVLDVETGEAMDLTPSSKRWFDFMDPSGQYDISPDGAEIAFAATRTRPPHDPVLMGIFAVSVPSRIKSGGKAGSVRSITPARHPADVFRPVYSPDGRIILYGLQREFDFYADKVRLAAYDRKTRTHAVLTESWDFSASGWTFGKDGSTVYLVAEIAGRTALFSYDLAKALKSPGAEAPKELLRGGTFSDPEIAGGRIFTSVNSIDRPPEAVACDLDGKGMARLTGFTDPVMAALQMGKVEEAIFEGAGGDAVQMYILYPPGSAGGRAKKKLPLVHLIHGGPHGTFGDTWHWRWNAQAFTAPGYLAALVNFHGSTSWGQDFTASILGRWGDQPYDDVMAATDYLIEEGIVDPKRMAATGGSYGGYMVSWIASQTDRFACLVNHAGVCDFQTQYASDITQGRRRSMGGEPWDDVAGMDRYNPMRHASGFRSPMLVIHGERDYRVPHDQAMEIYNIYKAMKLPARLVVYPDENHWILKPQNSRHWYGEVHRWLDRWIGKGIGKGIAKGGGKASS